MDVDKCSVAEDPVGDTPKGGADGGLRMLCLHKYSNLPCVHRGGGLGWEQLECKYGAQPTHSPGHRQQLDDSIAWCPTR
jgi:hypothetical protein